MAMLLHTCGVLYIHPLGGYGKVKIKKIKNKKIIIKIKMFHNHPLDGDATTHVRGLVQISRYVAMLA